MLFHGRRRHQGRPQQSTTTLDEAETRQSAFSHIVVVAVLSVIFQRRQHMDGSPPLLRRLLFPIGRHYYRRAACCSPLADTIVAPLAVTHGLTLSPSAALADTCHKLLPVHPVDHVCRPFDAMLALSVSTDIITARMTV
jgi:hypothetical protein